MVKRQRPKREINKEMMVAVSLYNEGLKYDAILLRMSKKWPKIKFGRLAWLIHRARKMGIDVPPRRKVERSQSRVGFLYVDNATCAYLDKYAAHFGYSRLALVRSLLTVIAEDDMAKAILDMEVDNAD